MRRNDILFETFENIKILLQYFYLSEENKIIKKGPFGNTEIRMTENLEFRGLNIKNRWEEICAITLCNLSFNKKR